MVELLPKFRGLCYIVYIASGCYYCSEMRCDITQYGGTGYIGMVVVV